MPDRLTDAWIANASIEELEPLVGIYESAATRLRNELAVRLERAKAERAEDYARARERVRAELHYEEVAAEYERNKEGRR